MKVLILGASSKKSVGYLVGEYLRSQGHQATYVSRTGKLGIACDITNPRHVKKIVSRLEPDILIISAGDFMPLVPIGSFKDWDAVRSTLAAKSFGPLVAANKFASTKTSGPKFLIALGGREISASPLLAAYTVGNGSLFALVRFLARHTKIRAFYIDLPAIAGTAMMSRFVHALPDR